MRGILADEPTRHASHPSFFNTMSGRVEPFEAIKAPVVKMYTCGPTVYDYAHIGNLRAYVFADLIRRALTYAGFEVEQTMNVTDFGHLTSDADSGDDKMLVALRRENKKPTLEAMREIGTFYTEQFTHDIADLNILPPSHLTRASDYVKEQISLIKTLAEKGYAYETSDGLYFDISRFKEYGKLGNIKLDALKEGARVEANPEKRHPSDFALWKKGDLGWDSSWGKGFPGWHIECTAMAFATLGKQLDIHTGGIDHIATHHNGEIAQAEAATGKAPYVRYWMHNAFITIEDRRIGKSEGNSITLRQLKERGYSGADYRYWLLTGHYRSTVNFTFDALDGAKQALYRLRRHIFEEFGNTEGVVSEAYRARFEAAIYDDLDTPKAIALIWELVKDKSVSPQDKVSTIRDFDRVLGLGLTATSSSAGVKVLGVVAVADLPKGVQDLVEQRESARARKAWDEADQLRQAINLHGYLVEDTPKGPRVTKS